MPSPDDKPRARPDPAALAIVPRRPARPSEAEKVRRARMRETWVEYVAELMRRLDYRTGVTGKHLEAVWNLPHNVYSSIAVEAGRRVRAELADDHDRIVGKVAIALDNVIDDAILAGDRHAVIKAAQALIQVTGASPPARVQVEHADLTALTDEQLQARKAELIKRFAGSVSVESITPLPPPAEDE